MRTIVAVLAAALVGSAVATVDVIETSNCMYDISDVLRSGDTTIDLNEMDDRGVGTVSFFSVDLSRRFTINPCTETPPSIFQTSCDGLNPSYGFTSSDSECSSLGNRELTTTVDLTYNPPALVTRFVGNGTVCTEAVLTVTWTCDRTVPTSQAPSCGVAQALQAGCEYRVVCSSAHACPDECTRQGTTVCQSGQTCYTNPVTLGTMCKSSGGNSSCLPQTVTIGSDAGSGFEDVTVMAGSPTTVTGSSVVVPSSGSWVKARTGAGLGDGWMGVLFSGGTSVNTLFGVGPSNGIECTDSSSGFYGVDVKTGKIYIDGVQDTSVSWTPDAGDCVWVEMDSTDTQRGTTISFGIVPSGGCSYSGVRGSLIPFDHFKTYRLARKPRALFHPQFCAPVGAGTVGIAGGQAISTDCDTTDVLPPLPSPSPSPSTSPGPSASVTPTPVYDNFCWNQVLSNYTFTSANTYLPCSASGTNAGAGGNCLAWTKSSLQRGRVRWIVRLNGGPVSLGVARLPDPQTFGPICGKSDFKGVLVAQDAKFIIDAVETTLPHPANVTDEDYKYTVFSAIATEWDLVAFELNLFDGSLSMEKVVDSVSAGLGDDIASGAVTISSLGLTFPLPLIEAGSMPAGEYAPAICSGGTAANVDLLAVEREEPNCMPWPSITASPSSTAAATPSPTSSVTPTSYVTPTVSPTSSPSATPSMTPTPSFGHLGTDEDEDSGREELTPVQIGIYAAAGAGALLFAVAMAFFVKYCTRNAGATRKQRELMTEPDEDTLSGFGGLTGGALTAEVETSNPMKDAEERKKKEEEERRRKLEEARTPTRKTKSKLREKYARK